MDDFSDPSWKIALLLQLPLKASVFLSGDAAESWKDAFAARGYRVLTTKMNACSSHAVGACDAVLHFPAPLQSTPTSLPSLLRRLGTRGQFLGLFRRRIALFRGGREAFRSLLSHDGVTRLRCARHLRRAEMGNVDFWLPLPNLPNVEEFSSADSVEEVEASSGRGRLYSRIFRLCSDGLGVYGARSHQSGLQQLLQQLEAGCGRQGIDVRSLRIVRFDLRARGALIAFLRSSRLPYGLVCRFADGDATRAQLQRHWDLQREVRADLSRIAMEKRIPRAVAQLDIGDVRCWIEERSKGTISWRLQPRFKSHFNEQLLGFLHSVAQLAGDERLATQEEIDAQLDVWAEQVSRLPQSLHDTLTASRRYLCAALRTEKFRYGWAHGDFGYGNAVASPADGQLEAVIDWETASRCSPVGLDLFNLLIQRSLEENSGNLQKSIAHLVSQIYGDRLNELAAGTKSYLARYLPRRTQQLICLGLTLHRWIRREHRHTFASTHSHDQLSAALKELLASAT